MSVISLPFFIFVAALVFLYYNVFRKKSWLLLLIASYIFYILNNPVNLIYLLVTTLTVYFGARKIDELNTKVNDLKNLGKEERASIKQKLEKDKKSILTLVLIVNFAMLSVFKYSGFVYGILGRFSFFSGLYSQSIHSNLINIIQPLGISFFIFQATGYMIDVYRKKFPAEQNVFKFALFVSYFPQIIQGPIGRWNELEEQFFTEPTIDYDNIRRGILTVTFGLIKKLIVANGLAPIVNNIFTDYANYAGLVVFGGVMLYGIQIYADFSGGIDIVSGVSQLFGINLAKNFSQPFFSTSLADFWRRWHISLGTWLKDYVFYSLNFSKPMSKLNKWARKKFGAKFGKFFSIAISTFVIYFIVGIWHGPGFKYIAFGIWNGTIIILGLLLEEFYENFKKKHNLTNSFWHKIWMIIRTNLLVVIGRYFTRASGYTVAKNMLKHTFANFNLNGVNRALIAGFGVSKMGYVKILIGLIIMMIYGILAERAFDFDGFLDKKGKLFNEILIFVIVVFLVLSVVYQDGYVSSDFIYRQY